MRILLISHIPMIRELGAGRVQLEAAEELRRLGHTVETFDLNDAFGERRQHRLARLQPTAFSRRARDYVQERPGAFDVIDALESSLPYSKGQLRFTGRLVSRSVGLTPLYVEYLDYERRRWRERIPGTALGQAVHRWGTRQFLAASLKGYRSSDLVRVLNDDERLYVADVLGLGEKVVQIPEGLPDAHLNALSRNVPDARSRLQACEVVAVGSWCLRKGAADWPAIVAGTRQHLRHARFSFLGTGVSAEQVEHELGSSDGIRVVPSYDPAELPKLVREATVGALPTYAEGYGLGIVEQLAAGIPSVAYDVGGPRTILASMKSLLVAPGDVAAFVGRLVSILTSDVAEYDALARQSADVGAQHRLSASIQDLVKAYEHGGVRTRREPGAIQGEAEGAELPVIRGSHRLPE